MHTKLHNIKLPNIYTANLIPLNCVFIYLCYRYMIYIISDKKEYTKINSRRCGYHNINEN